MLNEIPIKDAIEALEERARELLIEQKVYEMSLYGWEDAETPDREYWGHAVWQIDNPAEIDWGFLNGVQTIPINIPELSENLSVIGYDFEGLMGSARLSIGLALVYLEDASGRFLDEAKYFWLHHSNAIIELSTATDRIREFLILCGFKMDAEQYTRAKNKENKYYVTPFKSVCAQAPTVNVSEELQQQLNRL